MFNAKQNRQKSFSGFTLIELMIVVVIIGIVSAIAVPSYNSMISRNRVTTAVASLHSAFLLSRSEALKQGVPITICRSETTDAGSPSCADNDSLALANNGWADGWIIFSDNNGNGILEPGANPAERIISVQNKLARNVNDISIIPSTKMRQLTFNATGQVFGGQVQLTVNKPTSDSDASNSRFICIATGGRVIVSKVAC